eukprot:3777701-Rhodomonas_salina.4
MGGAATRMVSALLIVAKLTPDLHARHKLLESVATLLDDALALAPTNAALAEVPHTRTRTHCVPSLYSSHIRYETHLTSC